jgi:hypothetical protein
VRGGDSGAEEDRVSGPGVYDDKGVTQSKKGGDII